MLRGSIIIFSGILSIIFLKARLNLNNYIGMCVTAAGIVLVGLSSMLSQPSGPGSHLVLLGDALVVCGYVLAGYPCGVLLRVRISFGAAVFCATPSR